MEHQPQFGRKELCITRGNQVMLELPSMRNENYKMPNHGLGPDKWAWQREPKGGLTVKGAYRHLMKLRCEETSLTPALFFDLDLNFWKKI
ncbi:uncharacterized protein G2W53_039494 [Senna tora]|uniref:Uncharacterized protein n=1 Tax=Senna tora TaxID=362788 RepID=A0A834W3M0_9FABA|nr:uncharacterized protein G2W53_039494 [Senna tora]